MQFKYWTKLIQQNTANPIYIVRVGILTGSLTPLVPWARLVNFFPRVCQPVRRGCAFIPAPDTTFLNEQSSPLTALVVSVESPEALFLIREVEPSPSSYCRHYVKAHGLKNILGLLTWLPDLSPFSNHSLLLSRRLIRETTNITSLKR